MWEKELKEAIIAAKKARKIILEVYKTKFDVEIKSDDSPVTQADKRADEIIKAHLKKKFPNYAFLTEESEDNKDRLSNDYVWIIDPLDGTKDFVAKDDQFTTNIALSYKHQVVVGVVGAPATNEYFFASKGNGAFHKKGLRKEKIHVNDKLDNLTVLTSVFHTSPKEIELMEKYSNKIKNQVRLGSALKACHIASGKAEINYKLSEGTKEWDTAAFTIVVEEAGGLVLKPDGKPYEYNREDVYNHEGYVVVNRKENILL